MSLDALGAVVGPTAQRGVGVVVPYDFALDRELWRWAPDGVSLYLTRLPYARISVTVEMAAMISNDHLVRGATRDVLVPDPLVVAYACNSGSFVDGGEGERALARAMAEAGARVAVTASGAVVEALSTLGVRRVSVATPYIESLNERLDAYLDEHGVHVVSRAGLGLLEKIWTVPYSEVIEMVRKADRPEAEAVFVSCTNLPTYDVIGLLENELGKPVITANQATMWAALRAMEVTAIGPDQRLLAVA